MKNEKLTKEEVLRRVSADTWMEAAYHSMPKGWQDRFFAFLHWERRAANHL